MKFNFQLVFIIVFMLAAVVGVLVFSGAIPIGKSDSSGSLGTVVVWGTIPTIAISKPLSDFNAANPSLIVKYEEKSAQTFDQDLLEALAAGTGPDMFFIPSDLAFHYANKIFTVPYSSYPLASYKSIFAGAGEVFLTDKGILAFPVTIDPLMLYYNRSIFDANGVVYPPATWDDLVAMVPTLNKKDQSNKITKSAVALGHYGNVAHAKDILASLFMQAGNPIVGEQNGQLTSELDSVIGNYNLSSILKFYTDFADPTNPAYSWNRSFPNSDTAFSNESTAMYFGYASEVQSLVNSNPNENFFVTPIPQIKDAKFKLTGAKVTGIAVSSSSKNLNTAFTAANLMSSSPDFVGALSTNLGVAPARRDLLAVKQTDAYSPIFYSSALYARTWLDPSPKDTENIWSTMINGVLSGALQPDEAIKDAASKLTLLLAK